MTTLVSALVTLISTILNLVGLLIGAAFQVIFLLASCAPDPNSGWPGGDSDAPWWDNAFDLDDDDAKLSHGYNHVAGVSDSVTDPEGFYRPWFR